MIYAKILIKSFVLLMIFAFCISYVSNQKALATDYIINTTPPTFIYDLYLNSTGPDVLTLQRLLNTDQDTLVAVTGVGSKGNETSYFGPATKAGVIKFQTKYGIVPAQGYVGEETRNKLNSIYSQGLSSGTASATSSPQTNLVATSTIILSTPVNPTTTREVTFPELVEILISVGAIAPEKATLARSIAQSGSTVSTGASVDLKINGVDSAITVNSGTPLYLSWTSRGVTSCTSSSLSKPISGSQTVYASQTGTYSISCTGPAGSVGDSINVTVSGSTNNLTWNSQTGSWNSTPTQWNSQSGSWNSATGQWNTQSGTWGTNTAPFLTVSCSASPSYTQINSSVAWTATVSGGDGGYSYSWSGTDSLSGSGSSLSKTYTLSGSKSATVTVISGNSRASANCYISVSPAGTNGLYVSCSANPSYIKVGTNVNWSSTVLGATGTSTYLWTGSDGLSGTSPSISKIYSTDGNKLANLTVTSTTTSGQQTSTATCNANVIASTTTATTTNTTTATSTLEDNSPVVRVDFSGQVTGVLNCYDESGSPRDRFTQIIVSPCDASSPVIDRAYEYQSSTRQELGEVNGTQYGEGSSDPVMFLYDSVDGYPKPVVGQTILGIANTRATDATEKCPRTSPAGSPSGVPAGTRTSGWLQEYEVGNGACTATTNTTNNNSSGGTNDGSLFGTLGGMAGGAYGGILGAGIGTVAGGPVGSIVGAYAGYQVGSSIGSSVGNTIGSAIGW